MSYMPTMYLGAPNGESEFGSYNDFTKAINFFNKYNTCLDLGFDSGLKNQYFNYVSRGFLLNSYTFTNNSFIVPLLNSSLTIVPAIMTTTTIKKIPNCT